MSDDLNSIVSQAVDSAATTSEGNSEPAVQSEQVQPETDQEAPKVENDQASTSEQEGEEEEKFTKVNPNDLPEELKSVYKSLQKDYTKKRMAEAQEKRELQSRLQALEQQLSGSNQPQHQEVERNPQQQVPHAGMTLEEYTQYLMEQSKQATLQELQHVDEQKQITKETENIQNIQAEYFSSDNRLDPDSADYDEVLATYVSNKMQEKLTSYIEEKETSFGFDTQKSIEELVTDFEEKIKKQVAQRAKQQVQASMARDSKARKQSTIGVGSVPTVDRGSDLRSILEQSINI